MVGGGGKAVQSTLVFLRNSSCQEVGLCNRIYDTIVVFYLLIYLYWTGSKAGSNFHHITGIVFSHSIFLQQSYILNSFYDELH